MRRLGGYRRGLGGDRRGLGCYRRGLDRIGVKKISTRLNPLERPERRMDYVL